MSNIIHVFCNSKLPTDYETMTSEHRHVKGPKTANMTVRRPDYKQHGISLWSFCVSVQPQVSLWLFVPLISHFASPSRCLWSFLCHSVVSLHCFASLFQSFCVSLQLFCGLCVSFQSFCFLSFQPFCISVQMFGVFMVIFVVTLSFITLLSLFVSLCGSFVSHFVSSFSCLPALLVILLSLWLFLHLFLVFLHRFVSFFLSFFSHFASVCS